ncbi:uncharacterized protein LOC118216994 [Anguilla anguilla]|uniref:uncharacterized protein LOC118216994 n=1 Tax=Anguilla anguilla TaxID=7936 RepID=UPI0015AC2966|nr:uncharacterized protein LOC118216994 [Anguilla anguilla]
MDVVHTREELDQLAAEYTSDTLSCIHSVQEFCDRHSKWLLQRKTELEMMRDIMDRAEKINLTSDHFRKSEKKLKAFGQFLWSKAIQMTAESRAQELEKELECLLQETLEGLEKLTPFLEAVEKLAVTSLSVFREENPLCRLPTGTSAIGVRSVIISARRACPLLIHFQRDAGDFFLPSLVNVDALIFQLEKYVEVSQELCEKLQKREQTFYLMDNKLDFTEEAMKNKIDHLNLLTSIRLDQHFRMAYLFRRTALQFVGLLSQRSSRMRQFLEALEEAAVQLDRMKMGASISSVAGSSVGFAGGVVSIVGLALAPVTAGASLTLTLVGVGLGVTSGVNGLATGIAEMSVNSLHGKKVNEILQRYKEDVEIVLECLEQAASYTEPNLGSNVVDTVVGAGKMGFKMFGVSRKIDAIVDGASALAVIKNDRLATSMTRGVAQEGKAARNIPGVATDISDFGKAAKGTPLALSKTARAGFITLNSIFMGLDLFFICKDSISLAKGSKSSVSKVIRGRASLWKTELDAWERISHSLCIGIWRFRKSMEVLQRPFYS